MNSTVATAIQVCSHRNSGHVCLDLYIPIDRREGLNNSRSPLLEDGLA